MEHKEKMPSFPLKPTIPLALCALLCDGYTTYYGPSGQFAGSSSTINNSPTFYGPQGGYGGSAYSTPSGTTFYGPSGQFDGFSNSSGEFGE